MISDLAYRQYHVLFHPAAMPPPMVLNIDGAIVRSMLNDLNVAQINASMKRIASARREQACLENAYYFVRELRPFQSRGTVGCGDADANQEASNPGLVLDVL